MSKPVLYRFQGSIWAAAPELAIEELGCTDQVNQETVNLIQGANFEAAFLKINPKATLPTLVTPEGQVYDSTIKVVQYLIKNAPSGAQVGKPADPELLELVHEEKIDPNFFMLAARNEEELKAKSASVPGLFLRSRQKTLERVLETASPESKKFIEGKVASNGAAVAIYEEGAPADKLRPYFEKSQQNWDDVANFVTVVLPKYLSEDGFIGGNAPGEADYHVGAWLARIVQVLGGENNQDAWNSLSAFGQVPASVTQYWKKWQARNSWNVVYQDGLH